MLLMLEESGHWLENVDQTHLVLTSGKASTTKKYAQVLKEKGPSFFYPGVS